MSQIRSDHKAIPPRVTSAQSVAISVVLMALMWSLSATKFTSPNDQPPLRSHHTLDLSEIKKQVAALIYRSEPGTVSSSPER